jgi:DNA helicase-2/ATP-dependent DNA helicase PcrA
LMYVACTRAEQLLFLTWARRRGGARRTPSPLAAGISAAPADEAVPPPPIAAARARRGPDPVTEALLAWRRSAAVAAGLPETTICTDAALAAVAAARPDTVDDLAALPEVGPIAARRLGPRLLETLRSA